MFRNVHSTTPNSETHQERMSEFDEFPPFDHKCAQDDYERIRRQTRQTKVREQALDILKAVRARVEATNRDSLRIDIDADLKWDKEMFASEVIGLLTEKNCPANLQCMGGKVTIYVPAFWVPGWTDPSEKKSTQ